MTDLDALRGLTSYTDAGTLELLYELAGRVPAGEAIVEIGTYRGASACWLAAGAARGAGAHVWTVDPHDLPGERRPTSRHGGTTDYTDPKIRQHAAQQIASAGLSDRVTMVRAHSVDAAAGWDGPRVGLLYIDGDHREHAARRDFRKWQPHLAPAAVVAWDDYDLHTHPGVPRAVAGLVARRMITEPEVYSRLAVTQLRPAGERAMERSSR